MQKVISVMAAALVIVSALATNSLAWTLVFANDENGVTAYGSRQILIDSVRAGKKIRFNIGPGDAVMDGQTVEILDDVVCAQNTTHVSASWENGVMKTQSNAYHAYYVACTSGDVNVNRWLVGEHTPVGDTMSRNPVKWYVD